MAPKTQQAQEAESERARETWRLVKRQHDVVSRRQLLALGFTPDGIKHRIAIGRLHQVRRGVYAVGRPSLTQHGRWMTAVLACGEGAVLSHSSAAALWRMGFEKGGVIELSLPSSSDRGAAASRSIAVHPSKGGIPPPATVSRSPRRCGP